MNPLAALGTVSMRKNRVVEDDEEEEPVKPKKVRESGAVCVFVTGWHLCLLCVCVVSMRAELWQ